MEHSKKREFSKVILLVAGALNILTIAFAFVMIWRTDNLEPLAYLIPSVAAEVSAATSFYYWKAKAENMIKLKQSYGIENVEAEAEEAVEIEGNF